MKSQYNLNKVRKITFEGEFSDEEFENYLCEQILKVAEDNAFAIFSEPNFITISLIGKLDECNLRFGVISGKKIKELENYNVHHFTSLSEMAKCAKHIAIIVVTNTASKVISQFFDEVRKVSALEQTPCIYKIRGSETYPLLNEQDQWKELGIADTHVYITSQFDDGLLESIYRYTLTKVKRKCQIRDAYDLFQCLTQVERIDGDIIEFGSFQGHSGLLLAEYIKKRNLNKKLYLCDTFEYFPEVHYGIDKPWTNIHSEDFNFAQIKSLFEPYENVNLIKGEFEKTVNCIPSNQFSFAHIDCDTYSATHFVTDFIYPMISVGGIMVFEDYGHHELLGVRKAIDDFVANKQDKTFSMFSFFSGLKIIVRLA